MSDLASYQTRVERMLEAGESFSEIEDYIAGTPLSDTRKSALWLFGWAHQDPRVQLRLAKETLALVSDPRSAPARADPRPGAREPQSHRGLGPAAPS